MRQPWDSVEVTYENTFQMKNTKINILVYKFEPFTMNEDEIINVIVTDTKLKRKYKDY